MLKQNFSSIQNKNAKLKAFSKSIEISFVYYMKFAMNIPVLWLSYDFSTIPVVRLTSCPWLPVHALQFLHPSVVEPTFIYRISLIGLYKYSFTYHLKLHIVIRTQTGIIYYLI